MTRNDLVQGDVKRHLIALSMPMFWGILAIMSMNIADTFYVGQLGPEPLAAMGFTIPVLSVLLALAFGVGIGTSSVIARAIGAQQMERVRSYSTQGIFIALVIALIFAVVGIRTIDPVFSLLGAPPELMPLIHSYMDVWYLGSFVVVVPIVGNSALRAAGNTRVPSVVMISVAVVNIILDPILIFGLFGFPRLELAGAALATVIAYSISLAVGLYFLIVKLQFVTLEGCYRHVRASWQAILRIAIPSVGTNLIAPLSVAMTTWFVSRYGADAVAGFAVASRIEALSIVIIMSLSSIMGPFVGQNWGANRRDRVAEALNLAFRFVVGWSLAVALVLWLAGDALAGLFSDSSAIVDTASRYLYLVPITFGALGVVMVASSAANGTGDPGPALIMSLLRMVVLYLPLALLLSWWLDLTGVFLAIALSNLLVGVGALLWSRQLRQPASADGSPAL